jgi:signal transduction histidine kinase
MSLLAACGSVAAFVLAGDMATTDAVRGVARSFFADLNGILMLAPLLLIDDGRRRWQSLRGHRFEVLAQFSLVLAILCLIFALPDTEQLRVFYLLFVPVTWIALRWDWAGALAAVLVIQAGLVFAAESDIHTPRFIDTQLLMLTLGLTALLLGSVVAERRRSEQQLRERDAELSRAMRFAVAGELASATAHELNQPITALVSYLNAAEILSGTPAAGDERLRSTVRKATQEAMRASDVLHRLRNFYTAGRSRHERVRVAALCEAVAADFADALRRADVSLGIFADPALPEIETDATQLQIVLHNLIANAIDAAVHATDAVRRIEVWVQMDAEKLLIAVDDSGPGISPQVAERLFEPFVTSKPEGMGLGLAISRSLVRARGGELTCEVSSRLGGARLRVSLPRDLAVEEGRP